MTILTHVYYNETRNINKKTFDSLLNDRNLNMKLSLYLHEIDRYLYQSLVMQLKKSVLTKPCYNIITNKYIYAMKKGILTALPNMSFCLWWQPSWKKTAGRDSRPTK